MQKNILNLSKKNIDELKIFIIKLFLAIFLFSISLIIVLAITTKNIEKEITRFEKGIENINKSINFDFNEEDVITGLNNFNNNLEKIINDDNQKIINEIGSNLEKVLKKLDPILLNF